VVRLPPFPGLDRGGGYYYVGDPVAYDGFHHTGEISLGILQVSKELVVRYHASSFTMG